MRGSRSSLEPLDPACLSSAHSGSKLLKFTELICILIHCRLPLLQFLELSHQNVPLKLQNELCIEMLCELRPSHRRNIMGYLLGTPPRVRMGYKAERG